MSKTIWAMLVVLVAGAANAGGYRFEQAGVLDLASPERLPPVASPVATAPLAADQARGILAKPDRDLDDPAQIKYLAESHAQLRAAEAKLVAAEQPAVRRTGGVLSIKPTAGPGQDFRYRRAGDDSETFFYAGRIGAARYHRVEEQFEQDSPGSFLVNPASGKTVFVHNGGDLVELAKDGKRLLSFDPLNPPFLLVIAALDADGPRIELQCRATGDGIAAAAYKGWSADGTVELALTVKGAAAPLPLRIGPQSQGWQVATPEPAVLAKAGYACSS